jgi:two-component system nitrogen regulation sensor histidine kinase NtrY
MEFDQPSNFSADDRPIHHLPLSPSRRRLSFEKRLRISLYLLGLPLLIFCAALTSDHQAEWPTVLICMAGLVIAWMIAVSILMEQIVRPLQTLSNVVAALREDDYSFRARGASRNDALGDLALEVNALAGMLQSQRLGAMEAMALVQRVVESMQSPVLAFGPEGNLHLLNTAGERAFSIRAVSAIGKTAAELKLEYLLDTEDGELVSLSKQMGRWIVKRSYFRLVGVRHTLLMLSDVSAALREEERVAWERLIRVLGHEINNSLTPIKSIANSLRGRLVAKGAGEDFERGLSVIEDRAESLNRFLQAYRQLMGVPVPRLVPVSLAAMVERVVHLETRLQVHIDSSEDVVLNVDADQIQQALINLVRNATEAAMATETNAKPEVQIRWIKSGREVIIAIQDSGPGVFNETNLFVPFYTTKPGGTGIGLVLVQQIAEAHQGSIRLSNRSDAAGCVAELHLPWQDSGVN